jgi:hypothetical protein
MITKTHDHIYLAAGGVALLGTCIWAFLQQSDISSFKEPVYVPSSGSIYEPQPLNLVAPESRTWGAPKSQTAGADWLFDVFTPPKIYYNVNSKVFTVTIPEIIRDPVEGSTPVESVRETFGLQLVKVEQPLFRLQLIGHVGEGPGARGTFMNVATGDLIFGATGKKFTDLNLEVVRFSAERVRTQVEGGTEIIETVAKALVRDTVTGEEIPLDSQVRRPEGPLRAVFRTDAGLEVAGSSGEVISVGDNTFGLQGIEQIPPSVVVTKSGGNMAAPVTETLTIPPPAPPPSEDSLNPTNDQSTTGFPGF